jgi:hypothetical protein
MFEITIPQKSLSIIKDLDIVDASILVYCNNIIKTRHYTISEHRKLFPIGAPEQERKLYTWIDYNHLMESMPLLKITTKRALYNRLQKLVRLGLLKKETYKHNMPYFRLTERAEGLIITNNKKGYVREMNN